MSEIVQENGINIQELLESLDNDENQSIMKLTSKKIKTQLNKTIAELGLPKKEREYLLDQLTEYRHVDEIPDIHYSSIINMPSADFQKIIRDMGGISEKLEIKSVSNELIFRCVGQFASSETIRAETEGAMKFTQQEDSNCVIQGEFSLKNLSYFIKCTNLSSQLEIYLANDMPLVVKYPVASLAVIIIPPLYKPVFNTSTNLPS